MNQTQMKTDASTESLVARAADAFIERLNRGEQPEVEEHARRYPQIAAILRQVLPALQLMRTLTDDADSRGGSEPPPEHVTGLLGDYRIIREIGRGGMGVVYEAEQVSLGRRVALKVLPFAAVLDAKQIQRFRNEAHAAAQLHHTNIVPVFSVGCERGVHYYAMQHIEGRTLAELIGELRMVSDLVMVNQRDSAIPLSKRATMPSSAIAAPTEGSSGDVALPDTAPVAEGSSAALGAIASDRSTRSPAFLRSVANLGIQAAEALEHAHELGIVHRDIKPSNLLVDARGNLWITDFGLAHMQSDPGLTMTGDLLGTLRYMSPEQALAKRVPLDHRTDIYSLGVTLYELMTLQPAVAGRDRQELLRRIAFEEPAPPRRLNDVIPTDLETIVLKTISKNPAERYGTARELADDLRRFLEDKPIKAKRPTLLARATKWSRRHRTVVAAAAVLMVMAVVGLSISTALIWREQARTEAAWVVEAKQRKRAEQVARFTQEMLSGINPEIAKDMDKRLMRMILDQAAKRVDTQLSDQPEIEAAIRSTIGRSYEAIGEYEEAEPHLVAARNLRRRLLGEEHPKTLTSVQALAILYHRQGHFDKAERLHRKVLEMRKDLLGEEHADTLKSMHNLALLYMDKGRYAEAESLYLKTLETRERVLGKEHPDTLKSMHGLIIVYQAQGHYDEAKPLYLKTLDRQQRVLGEDHPDTLGTMHNLASLYVRQGRYAEAEPLFLKTLEMQKRVLGNEHPDTLDTMNDLANLHRRQGRYAEAEGLHLKVLETRKRLLGEEHPRTLNSMGNLGIVYAQQGRLADAEPLFAKTLETQKRVLGQEHPDTLNMMNNLAALYYSQGRYDECERLQLTVLETRQRVLGDEHPRTLSSMNNLAVLYYRQGRYAEAESLHLRVLETEKRVLGEEHPDTLSTMNNLAYLYKTQRRYDEAEPLYLKTLETRKRVLGKEHPETLRSVNNLAILYRLQGRYAEAEPLFREALARRRKVLGDEHPHVADSLHDFGKLFQVREEYSEAEPLLRECLAIRRKTMPDGHWETLVTQSILGASLAGQGKFEEAETMLLDAYAGLNAKPETIPSAVRDEQLGKALQQRILNLYEAWDKPEEAAEWRAKLNEEGTKARATEDDAPSKHEGADGTEKQ